MDAKEFFLKIDGIVDPVVGGLIKKYAEAAYRDGREAQLEEDLKELVSASEDLKMLERRITDLLFAWQTKLKLIKKE